LSGATFAALAAARWLHFASVMLLFGASLFPFYALPLQTTSVGLARARSAFRLAASIALLSGIAWAAASLVNITGDVASLFDRDALTAFLFDTGFGRVWWLRLLLLLAMLVAAFIAARDMLARDLATLLVAASAALLLVSQAWIGHPAASLGGEGVLVTVGYAVHVLGAGAWLGGLIPLLLIMRAYPRGTLDHLVEFALRRFSALGMFAIAAILAGGLINAWARWNSLDILIASAWGKVLFAKLLGFAVLLILAAMNRFILMQRFASDASARNRLVHNVVAEQAGGVAILAAAAILGILPPPA
jgi:putative copper resistance protein D